jgi:hypothetical protein
MKALMAAALFGLCIAANADVLNGNIHQVYGGWFSPDGGKIFLLDAYDPGKNVGSVYKIDGGPIKVEATLCADNGVCRTISDQLYQVAGNLYARADGSRLYTVTSGPLSVDAQTLSVLGGDNSGGYVLYVQP